jgi:vancomycin resistance protein YoaR
VLFVGWTLLAACIVMAGYVIIWPGTSVVGIDVGGLTARAAESLLADKLCWDSREILLIGHDTETSLLLGAELGVTPDLKATIRGCMRPLWGAFTNREKPLFLTVDREKLSACIASLSSSFAVPVRDAEFRIDAHDRVVVIPHVVGKSLKASSLEDLFLAERCVYAVPDTVVPEFHDTEPRVRTEELEAFLPMEIVSSCTTYYAASKTDRAHNISIAASSMAELVIWPGETFSFNMTVGPRTPDRGYRKAPVIVGGRLEDDYGGGVCQVSTTAYVAMLQAGFSITERYCHGLPVDYVPLGLDATVAWDYLDLKMTNPGPFPCILRARTSHGALTVDVFGKKTPGLRIEVESRVIKEIPAEPVPQPVPGTGTGPGSHTDPGRGSQLPGPGGDVGEPSSSSLRPGYLVETIRRYIRNGVVEKVEKLNTSSYPPEEP